MPALKAISLPLRSRALVHPNAKEVKSEHVAAKVAGKDLATKTPSTSKHNNRTNDLYLSGDTSDASSILSPLLLFPDVDPIDPKDVQTLKDIEETVMDGPEPLSYY